MTFPGVSQPESNDYFPPLAKIRIAFDHVFFDLFSIIALWYARTTRHVILHNLREKSADDLNFWWSYCNFCPRPVTIYFTSYLSLRRVLLINVLQVFPGELDHASGRPLLALQFASGYRDLENRYEKTETHLRDCMLPSGDVYYSCRMGEARWVVCEWCNRFSGLYRDRCAGLLINPCTIYIYIYQLIQVPLLECEFRGR